MAAGAPREQDGATRLRERPAERKIVLMQKAAHVVPVALIQFTDFASDVMVIVQLATMDGAGADWIVCVAAVGLSLLVAWFFVGIADDLSSREKLVACVLACGNLHVLYVGTRYISAGYEGQSEKAEKLYGAFVLLKMLETGIESVVLGLVTAGAFVRTLDGGSGLALFASSLALSLLSMAYGFFGQAANDHADDVGHRRPALFLCLLVHLCWGVGAFGTLAAAAGPWWLLGLWAMVALGGVRQFFALTGGGESLDSPEFFVLFSLITGLPLVLMDRDFLTDSDDSKLPASQIVAFAAARRAVLFGVAATGVALAPSPAIAAVLAALFLADLLCSPHAFRLIGAIEWDPLSALLDKCTRPAARVAGAPTPAAPSAAAKSAEPGAARPAATGDYAALLDMLEAIAMQCDPPNGGGAAGAARPDGTDELGAEAKALRLAMLTDPDALSRGALAAAVTAVGEYKPWEEGAQRLLVGKLRSRQSTALAEPPAARPRPKHPLRALPLAVGLLAAVWATKPSFFGSQPTGTNYDLSVDASHVDYFVRRPPFARTPLPATLNHHLRHPCRR